MQTFEKEKQYLNYWDVFKRSCTHFTKASQRSIIYNSIKTFEEKRLMTLDLTTKHVKRPKPSYTYTCNSVGYLF